MSPATRNSKPTKLAARLLGSVARFLLAYPLLVISSFLVATVASVLVTVAWLQLQTDQNALVSNDEVYHQRYMEFLDEFGDQEFLHVVIEVDGKAERAVELADEIAAEVAKIEEHVRATYHRIPADAFGSSILLLPRYSHDTLEELVEGLEGPQCSEDAELTRDQMWADANGLLAERALQGGGLKRDGESIGRADRFQVVVHVNAETLAESSKSTESSESTESTESSESSASSHSSASSDSSGSAESSASPESSPSLRPWPKLGGTMFENGVRVPAGTSRRIACDSSRVVMTHDSDGSVLDVGRKTRTVPPAMRRAASTRTAR